MKTQTRLQRGVQVYKGGCSTGQRSVLRFWQARFWQREDGANLVLMAFVMMGLLGFAALAIDGGNIYYQSQRMQISADAAALGGARKLAISADHDAVNSEIRQLAFANSADAVTWDYINNERGVHVVAMRTVPAYFARIYGTNVFTVTANAEAQYEPVTGVDGLFPLTLDCDCVDEDDIIPVQEGEGGGSTTPPTPTATPDTDTSPSAGTIQLPDNQNSSYGITYLGQSGNTWSYQVEEINGRDLSHWLLNINSCLSNIVSYIPNGAAIGMDGSTGVPGIKWDVASSFTNGTFSFTLDNSYPSGMVQALAKAGTSYGTVNIRGPLCGGTNTGIDPGGSSGTASLCLPTLDFETDTSGAALVAGQIIDTEWAAWGIRVTTHNPTSNPAMIFNTANPTGGDFDLGAPNQAYGGPGIGVGGGPNSPGANSVPLGKVLIVAETPNSANPDDRANGGTIIFTFNYPVRIDDVRILDIDNASAAGTIKAFRDTAGTTLIATGRMQGFGDNSVQTVTVNAREVRRMEINFPQSGAVASVVSCRSATQATYRLGNLVWYDLDGDGIQDVGEPGIAGVKLELYLRGQNYIIATATSNAGGEYVFTNLPPAEYEVKIAPSNFQPGGVLHGATYSPKDATGNGSGAAPTATSTNTPTSAPTSTPTRTPTAAPSYCHVAYRVTNDWGSGFNAEVVVTNRTNATWNTWNVTWQYPGNQRVTAGWHGTYSQSGQNVTLYPASWNATIPPNNSVTYGFQGTYSGANGLPTNFTVSGVNCGNGGSILPTATPIPAATATPMPTATTAAGTPPTPAACTVSAADINSAVSTMNQYGLTVLGDLQSFGEVDHFAFIGGNLLTSNSVQFGTHAQSVACSTRALTVVGNIASGSPLNIQKGSLALKGTLQGGRMVNYNGGQGCGLVMDSTLSAGPITTYMQNAAASLASIPANNATPTVNAGGNLMFNVTSKTANGLAVFNITGSQLFNSANGVIEFSDSVNATTILINVSGSSMNWTHGNMGNYLTSYSSNITKVIWNFHQATSINTNSRRFAGAMLAPYAAVNAGSGNLEGSVVVRTLVNAGEIHNPVFALSNTTPLTTACGSVTPTPPATPTVAPTNTPMPTNTPTRTPTPGVNDDTRDSDFDPNTGRAPALISNVDNPTVDGGFILPDTGPQSAIINLNDGNNSQYEVTLVGTVDRTWTYRVRKISGRDLSYWSLGIVNCMDKIVSYSPTLSYSSGTDASTGFVGVKWTVPTGFTDGTFSVTFDRSYQARSMPALLKVDTFSGQVSISGADCTLPTTEPEVDPGGETGGGGNGEGEGNACSFGWIDWNGGTSSQMELASYMANTQLSGVRSLNEVLTRGPDVVYSSAVAAELNALTASGATLKIPLTTFNGRGYAICGFANVRLLDYQLQEGNNWLNLQFLQTLIHGVATDPNAPDFGVRDVRFER